MKPQQAMGEYCGPEEDAEPFEKILALSQNGDDIRIDIDEIGTIWVDSKDIFLLLSRTTESP